MLPQGGAGPEHFAPIDRAQFPPSIGAIPPSDVKNGPLVIADLPKQGPAGWYNLSTVRPDGSLQPLVRCPHRVRWCGEVQSIDWAPDGDWLAFSVTSLGVSNPYNGIHVVNPSIGIDRQIPSLVGERDWWDLDWSPDGSHLAYAVGQIYILSADGRNRRVLPTHTGGPPAFPSWSPNGRWIAFSSKSARGSSVYRVRINGKHLRLLARHGSAPVWSPRGNTIAYRNKCGINLITPSGRTVKQRAPGRCHDFNKLSPPEWSPDGRQIAFAATTTAVSGTWVMNADGTHIVRVTPGTQGVWMDHQVRPAWRPTR